MLQNNMIEYYSGDVRNFPRDKSIVIIPHCCNDLGIMGAGVARAILDMWPNVYDKYKVSSLDLGSVNCVEVDSDNGKTIVANMIGQHGVGIDEKGNPPVRYHALCLAMHKVAESVKNSGNNFEIHCPVFGCDLAGGDWGLVSKLVEEIWCCICPVKCIVHPNSAKFQYLLD